MAWECVCGTTNDDSTTLCDYGTTRFKAIQKLSKKKRHKHPTYSSSDSTTYTYTGTDGMSGFFSFRSMLSTQIIKLLYFLGYVSTYNRRNSRYRQQ